MEVQTFLRDQDRRCWRPALPNHETPGPAKPPAPVAWRHCPGPSSQLLCQRMKLLWLSAILLTTSMVLAAEAAIDRRALVGRHAIDWTELRGEVPLGNGEFCFNVDATGLQTFGGNTMSHWAWHSAPLPRGCTPADVPPTGTVERGRIQGPMRKAAERPELDGWMFRNPHPINLARVRFVRGHGRELSASEVRVQSRQFDLWTGRHVSRFEVDGQTVVVETWVHPVLSQVAVRAQSPLLAEGRLAVTIDFPYPSANHSQPWVGDWNRPQSHTTEWSLAEHERTVELRRTADAAVYLAGVTWGAGAAFGPWPTPPRPRLTILSARFGRGATWVDVTDKISAAVQDDGLLFTPSYEQLGDPLPGQPKQLELSYALDGEPKRIEAAEGQAVEIQPSMGRHSFRLAGNGEGLLEFVCGFSSDRLGSMPGVEETKDAAVRHWEQFWRTGGAVDLSGSRDPRWRELERRIVLSQYHMAAQSAGSWPSAENGLMGVDFWSSQFHMEMIWWHLAHYGLWDRWPLAERALECYRKFLPVARQLAQQFDYPGAKWGKQVGPEGRTAPWDGSFALHWQQPHPIFFAELEYRLRPGKQTLEKWAEVIFETAEYMAAFPTRDAEGVYHLQPIMPPSEQGFTRDTVFDLAYWRWGLDQAQRWRERMGLARQAHWDEVRAHLAPLPTRDGWYVHSAEWNDTYSKRAWEHPDPIGVLGMLPPMEGVDGATAHRTTRKVWETWDWTKCWGWDFPWMAMAAARVGEPEIAVEALLKEAGNKNRYDPRGVNLGGPCPYLPGNGGLLYAVAMMAAGWDGAPDRHAPGFPQDGRWVIQWEGLKPAP